MKTPRYGLATRMAAAAAVALAGTSLAVPALAVTGPAQPAVAGTSPTSAGGPAATAPEPATATSAPAATAPVPGAPVPAAPVISDAGLAAAMLRDLGMTLQQFNAAGELAKRAADALPSLRGLPGYIGISLKDGRIVVAGSGVELQARVDGLNAAGSAPDFVLAPPAASVAPKAPSAAERIASSTDQLFEAYIREVGPAGLQAVAYAGGRFVIRTGGLNAPEAVALAALKPLAPALSTTPAPGKISAAEFVSRYKNVELEQGAPVKTEQDKQDLFGGQGYVTDVNTICSTGFGAFDAAGLPVVLTAGHCAEDGRSHETSIEPATAATAGGAATPLTRPLAPLGSFGFSQFGGPGNSWALDPAWETGDPGEPGNVGTDIAIIKGLADGIDPQPAATKWRGEAPAYTGADPANPAPTAVKIIGMVSPFEGQKVCLSGRTTGWSCGQVDEVGIYVAGGITYPTNSNDVRAFKGFRSNSVESSGGDSGGPWISGNFAVGTHSAGESRGASEKFAVATTLADALSHVPFAVQLQLFLNRPELAGTTSGSTVATGTVIQGRVPAAPAAAVAENSSVRLVRSGQEAVDVPVDEAGNWSFNAPASEGSFDFTAQTVNGYSRSETTSFSLRVSTLAAPAITSPAAGATIAAPKRVAGTGTPGNVVKLSGDVTGSAPVAADGTWSVSIGQPPAYGKISVSAVQTSAGHEDSPSTSLTFSVPPPAPAVTTALNGSTFGQDSLPATLAGTGVEGAEVSLSVDGKPVAAQRAGAAVGGKSVVPALVPLLTVADGRWSMPFPAGLAAGSHTFAVSQSIDGVVSPSVVVRFTVSAPVTAPAVPGAPPAAKPSAAASVPGAAPSAAAPSNAATAWDAPAASPSNAPAVGPAKQGPLANTGAGSLLPAAGLAAGALLLGGVLIAFSRRRKVS